MTSASTGSTGSTGDFEKSDVEQVTDGTDPNTTDVSSDLDAIRDDFVDDPNAVPGDMRKGSQADSA